MYSITEVYICLLDLFIPTDLTRKEVLRAYKEDQLKPFELVREIVEDAGVRGIKNVKLYKTFFRGKEFLIEYFVTFSNGQLSVKLIGSNEPQKTLNEYYKWERTPP